MSTHPVTRFSKFHCDSPCRNNTMRAISHSSLFREHRILKQALSRKPLATRAASFAFVASSRPLRQTREAQYTQETRWTGTHCIPEQWVPRDRRMTRYKRRITQEAFALRERRVGSHSLS